MPINKKRYARQRVNHRILALHEAIADKLVTHPDLLGLAQQCMQSRYQQGLMAYGTYIVWQSLLPLLHSHPHLFKQELLATDPKMEQMRRETIFVGILDEQERQDVIERFYSTTSCDD